MPDIAAWCSINFGDNPLYYAHHLYSDENTEITNLVIPNSVTNINKSAFSGCTGLTSIEVDTGNTKYDSRNDCNAIIETATNTLIAGCRNTIIPNSVTSIGGSAFYGCRGLTSITIPESVTSIGNYAFRGCSSLTFVTIGNSVRSIGEYTFWGCSGLTSVTIPNSVKSIRADAFGGCSSLTFVTIGNSVTSIGNYAFEYCSSLENVYCYAENVPTTDSYAFNHSSISSATLHVPAGSISSYRETSPWSGFGQIVIVQNYNLTYVIDGEIYKSYLIDPGTAITPEPEPTKEGYTFSGWSEIPETMPAHDVTVTGTLKTS